MLFKLSIKNIKKSIKDYSIYFFTLVTSVVIFYIFNSLDAQESILIMSESKYEIVKALIQVLNYISVFISFILGFLIVYSNNFLIKRRKKEFGLYLTLGMSKSKVSFILVIETLLVGLLSLVVGLFIGIFLSQFLSIFIANLFEADMNKFTFIFSKTSLIKTILYFGIIFVLVMLFNVFTISRHKLINLLTAEKKNEKIKSRNVFVTIISFLSGIGLLIYAYYNLFNGALFEIDSNVIYMIVAGALGTFLLFFSASGFFLKIFEKIKKIYYKNLNMFVLKQVNNKINTTVFSTTVICLMLLLTIGILSGSMSLINVFNNDVNKSNITDLTVTVNTRICVIGEPYVCEYKYQDSEVLEEITNKDYFKELVNNYAYYEIYNDEKLTITDFMDEQTKNDLIKNYGTALQIDTPIDIMTESDYNKVLKLYGEQTIDIKDNEYILTSGVNKIIEFFGKLYESGNQIEINNKLLKPATKEIVNINFQNSSSASNGGTIIVSDEYVESLNKNRTVIILNYNGKDKAEIEKMLTSNLSYEDFGGSGYFYISRLEMEATSVGMKAILIFVGLYLGIIFAISSATMLAIGQLSESSDNKSRYKVLKDIGADDKMIKKSLFSQIGIAFLLPLIVALFHAYFGLKELNDTIELMGEVDLTSNILLTTIFIVIIYGGYFVATYVCSKNIIKE